MVDDSKRMTRLRHLVDLARAYRDWTRQETAAALGRNITRLYSESPDPRLSFVLRLSEALDWPVEHVIGFIEGNPGGARTNGHALSDSAEADDYDRLKGEAARLMNSGAYDDMLAAACRLQELAHDEDQRAEALNWEGLAWMSLGRYSQAVEALRLGLQRDASELLRYCLRSNLAFAYYQMWDLTNAYPLSHMLCERIGATDDLSPTELAIHAHNLRTRGDCVRRLLQAAPLEARPRLAQAKADLENAMHLLRSMHRPIWGEADAALANTCAAGCLELSVELGQRGAREAIEDLGRTIPTRVDPTDWPAAAWLDSFGWTCIYISNIALRHLRGAELQHVVGVYAEKALDFADRLDNWALRERVTAIQLAMHEQLSGHTGLKLEMTIDQEDIRRIAGVMGRFPTARETGLRIFEYAKVVQSEHLRES